MKNATAAYALNTAERFAKIGSEATHLKSNLIGVAKDAKRAIRKGRYAAEQCVDEVSIAVKRRPLKSIGICLWSRSWNWRTGRLAWNAKIERPGSLS